MRHYSIVDEKWESQVKISYIYLNDSLCKVNPSNVVEYDDDMLGIKGLPIYINNKIWKINYKLPEF